MRIADAAIGGLRLDRTFLIVRLAAFAVATVFSTTTDVRPLAVVAIVALTFAAQSAKRPPLLPYAFLTAAAMWGGVAAASLLTGDAVSAVLACVLAFLDASAFTTLWCRR
jgi:hypothetical protein